MRQQDILIAPGTSESATARWTSVVSGAGSAFSLQASATSPTGTVYRCAAGATSGFYASAWYHSFRGWNCEATFKFVLSANTSFEALFGIRSDPFTSTGHISLGRSVYGFMASLNATTFSLLAAGNGGTQVSPSTPTVTLPTAGIPIYITLHAKGDQVRGTYWCDTTPTRVTIDWLAAGCSQPLDTGGFGTVPDDFYLMIGMCAKSAAARNLDVSNIWVNDLSRRASRRVST